MGIQGVKKDLANQKFGMLTALESTRKDNHGNWYWLCKCECGNLKETASRHLLSGNVKSCGCLRGISNSSRAKHRLCNHKLYEVWRGMLKRCFNPKNDSYNRYGGRGITVCVEWQRDFMAFYTWSIENGYREGLQIDRINVNGNYEPSNCRYVTPKENCNNRTNNVPITINGVTHNLYEWQEISGVRYQTIKDRLDRGIIGEKLLKKPSKREGSSNG